MILGPLFSREVLTAPRQLSHFLIRAGYVAALVVLMYTAAQTTFGWQQVRNPGDIARFGALVFQIFSFVQLMLIVFFSALFAAGTVAQEKDRRTLVLLLMTDLRDRELVLGKLAGSLFLVGVLLATSVTVLLITHGMGGVSIGQIGSAVLICAAAGLASGAWGSLVAFWKEKTFQTLAIALLGIVIFIVAVETLVALVGNRHPAGVYVGLLDPFRTLGYVFYPLDRGAGGLSFGQAAAISAAELIGVGSALVGYTIYQLRVWNPNRGSGDTLLDENAATGPQRQAKTIWEQPILWREMCTYAYGQRVIFIKVAFLLLEAVVLWALWQVPADAPKVLGMISPIGFGFVGLGLLTLLLVNAQGVTAITTERDAATLELLQVTDVTAKEFTLGKLGGVLFNTKELILGPLVIPFWQIAVGSCTVENGLYVVVGFLSLVIFAAMLGLHYGLSHGNSRRAIATSLGTIFFLFVGIFISMLLILQARSSFSLQLPSFLVFILGGSLGLWSALTHRNPSPALTLASGILPFFTFYAIVSFLLGQTLGVCFFVVLAYGFTFVAMLVPAISEYDTALGRTTVDQG